MSRKIITIMGAAIFGGVAAGYWWGARGQMSAPAPAAANSSAVPNKPANTGKRKILYFRHPMGLPDTSPVPKVDSMGMAYVPVYADETPAGAGFVIPGEKLQRLGIRTVAAGPRALARTVRAVGTVQIDERRQTAISPKFEGYVTRLYVSTTGAPVRRGQPLLEVYSPELVSAQEEILIARQNLAVYGDAAPEVRARFERLVAASRSRLTNWGVNPRDLGAMQQSNTQPGVVLRSPATGVVIEKLARVGQRFMAGEVLYQVAELDRVWLVANVFEQDVAALASGRQVRATFDAYPGRAFVGRVALVYPALESGTRTLAVRIEMANTDGALKPGLYGNVEIAGPAVNAAVAVPNSAVLDSGKRQLVFVAAGGGRFESREVEIGTQADGFVAVLRGLAAGESVVVDGNFLIDAESNLRAGTQALGHAHGDAAGTPSSSEADTRPGVTDRVASPASSDHDKHGTP